MPQHHLASRTSSSSSATISYPDLGCIGSKPIITPNLDRLAAEGVRATSFYVTWPACTPSRGSVLTGRFPQRNGLYDMVRNDKVDQGHRYTLDEYGTSPEMTLGLDPRELTIGDLLTRAGWRCGSPKPRNGCKNPNPPWMPRRPKTSPMKGI